MTEQVKKFTKKESCHEVKIILARNEIEFLLALLVPLTLEQEF